MKIDSSFDVKFFHSHFYIGHRMSKSADPRVFFAAERTLLAWIRTGLTIMAFGFVVSRFGIFLSFIRKQNNFSFDSTINNSSTFLGLSMIVLGSICIFFSAYQHHGFIRSISEDEIPQMYHPNVVLTLAILIGSLGGLVGASLVLKF